MSWDTNKEVRFRHLVGQGETIVEENLNHKYQILLLRFFRCLRCCVPWHKMYN